MAIISLHDFETLPEEEKKSTLKELKESVGVRGITDEWGISRTRIYKMFHQFEIPVNPRGFQKTKAEDQNKDQNKTVKQPGAKLQGRREPKVKEDTGEKTQKFVEGWAAETEANHLYFSLNLSTQGRISDIRDALQFIFEGKLPDVQYQLNLVLKEVK